MTPASAKDFNDVGIFVYDVDRDKDLNFVEELPTQTYRGFTIEVGYQCDCDIYEDAICGFCRFFTGEDGITFGDGYRYGSEPQAFEDARRTIDLYYHEVENGMV